MRSYSSLYDGDGPIILNKRLLPLTLGHVVHLTNTDSLFLKNFKLQMPSQMEDLVPFTACILDELANAISICSMTYDEYDKWKWNVPEKKRWFRKFNQDVQELEDIGKLDLFECVYLFNDYVEAAHKGVKFLPTPSKNGSTPTPPLPLEWYVPMVHSLCTAYHMSKSEVFNQPVMVSILDFYTNAQANSEGRILPEDQSNYIEEIRTKNVTPEMKAKLAEALANHMRGSNGRK